MRKVFVNLTVRLVINVNEGTEVQEVIDELQYDFTDTTGKAKVMDSSIIDSDVTNSK